MRYLKNTLAVVVGTVAAMIIITCCEWMIGRTHPLPAGTDVTDKASLQKALQQMPLQVFILILAGYAIAALAAGIIATIISKREKKNPALVSGSVLTIMGIINAVSLQHPAWFCAANIISVLFAYLGYLAARKKTTV